LSIINKVLDSTSGEKETSKSSSQNNVPSMKVFSNNKIKSIMKEIMFVFEQQQGI
jgi:hypothetical protein